MGNSGAPASGPDGIAGAPSRSTWADPLHDGRPIAGPVPLALGLFHGAVALDAQAVRRRELRVALARAASSLSLS